jgi:hypothetical protein
MKLCLLGLFSILLFSCAADRFQAKTFNPSNLTSFFVKIEHNKDYLFRTPKGAVILVKKGTFSEDLELEIKEAYTMKDILLGGLVLQSHGQPLKSGGMIYIDRKDGGETKMNYPISVAIPAIREEESMALYKGELTEDSTIDWSKVDTVQAIGEGKTL